MPVECTTPQSQIDALLNLIPSVIGEEITRAFAKLGEECLIKIRNRSGEESWFDRTGNLRSSIGYAVYDYGKDVIRSSFNVVKTGSDGTNKGNRMIDELASLYASTYALVVVAGMEYAEYVEAMENKDVLANTYLWARSVIQIRLHKALDRASKRLNSILM